MEKKQTQIELQEENIRSFFKELFEIFEDVHNFQGDWQLYDEVYGYDVDVNHICRNLIYTLLDSNSLEIEELINKTYVILPPF